MISFWFPCVQVWSIGRSTVVASWWGPRTVLTDQQRERERERESNRECMAMHQMMKEEG